MRQHRLKKKKSKISQPSKKQKTEYKIIRERIIAGWIFFALALTWNTIRIWITLDPKILGISTYHFIAPSTVLLLQIAWFTSLMLLYRKIKSSIDIVMNRAALVKIMFELIMCFGISIITYTVTEIALNVVNYMELLPPGVKIEVVNTIVSRVLDAVNYALFAFYIVITFYVHKTAKKLHLTEDFTV